jgi:hypothetical protein
VDEIIPLSPGELMNTGAEPLLDKGKKVLDPFLCPPLCPSRGRDLKANRHRLKQGGLRVQFQENGSRYMGGRERKNMLTLIYLVGIRSVHRVQSKGDCF